LEEEIMDHQAFAQLLGNYGEFVGAIAVVGTLIYLAVQVRQSKESLDANTHALEENKRLTKAEVLRALTRYWDEINSAITQSREMASIFVRGNRDPSDLDEVDQVIYTGQLIPFLNHQVTTRELYEGGFVDHEIVEIVDELVGHMLRSRPGALKWWEAVQHGFPHREHVDQLIHQDVERRFTLGDPIAQPSPSV
jgi:hypothetical protein